MIHHLTLYDYHSSQARKGVFVRNITISIISLVFLLSGYINFPIARSQEFCSNKNRQEQGFQSTLIDPKRKELWEVVPDLVRSKVIAEELKVHPEVAQKERDIITKYIKFFGASAGRQIGTIEALVYRTNWINFNIINKHECVVWGHVEKDYEKRDKTVIKAGDYLTLYKLSGKDAVLFWGPVAATDEDHKKAGMSPGSRYNKCSLVLDLSRNEYVHARPT